MDGRIVKFIILALLCSQVVWSRDVALKYSRLVQLLKRSSDPELIPVFDNDPVDPVIVKLSISLINILEVDVERNQVELIIWTTARWTDPTMRWGVEEFSNVTMVRLPKRYVWTPDIVVYNSVAAVQELSPSLTMLNHDGSNFMVESQRVRVACDLQNVKSSTGAECALKMGSWAYNSDLILLTEPSIDTNDYVPNQSYELMSTYVTQNVIETVCCAYQEFDFMFVIGEKRRNSDWF